MTNLLLGKISANWWIYSRKKNSCSSTELSIFFEFDTFEKDAVFNNIRCCKRDKNCWLGGGRWRRGFWHWRKRRGSRKGRGRWFPLSGTLLHRHKLHCCWGKPSCLCSQFFYSIWRHLEYLQHREHERDKENIISRSILYYLASCGLGRGHCCRK